MQICKPLRQEMESYMAPELRVQRCEHESLRRETHGVRTRGQARCSVPSIRLEHEDSVTITKPQEDSVQIPSTKNRFTGFTCYTGRRGMRKHASSKNTLLHWATRYENIHDFQEHLEDVAYTLDPEAKSGSASGTGTRQL